MFMARLWRAYNSSIYIHIFIIIFVRVTRRYHFCCGNLNANMLANTNMIVGVGERTVSALRDGGVRGFAVLPSDMFDRKNVRGRIHVRQRKTCSYSKDMFTG